MSESNVVSIEAEDVFEELKQENRRLLNELIFAEKCINLLEKFRTNLKSFNNNCKCDETIEYKLSFNELETKYKFIKRQFDCNYGASLSSSRRGGHQKRFCSIKAKPNKIRGKVERNKRLRIIDIQRKIIRQIDLKKSRIEAKNSIDNSSNVTKRDNINDESSGCESDSSKTYSLI